jgi:hypothetical protein
VSEPLPQVFEPHRGEAVALELALHRERRERVPQIVEAHASLDLRARERLPDVGVVARAEPCAGARDEHERARARARELVLERAPHAVEDRNLARAAALRRSDLPVRAERTFDANHAALELDLFPAKGPEFAGAEPGERGHLEDRARLRSQLRSGEQLRDLVAAEPVPLVVARRAPCRGRRDGHASR